MAEFLYATSHIAGGTFPNPDNANGNTPGTWAGALDTNSNYTSRWAMGDPVDPLTDSATQTIRVVARKGSASGTPTISLNLYENGVLVQEILATTGITSQVGQTLTGTFNSGAITNRADVEIEVVQTGQGGPVGTRNSAQISHIEWEADTTEGGGETPQTLDDTLTVAITDSISIEVTTELGLSDTITVALSDSISLRKVTGWSDSSQDTTFEDSNIPKSAGDTISVALTDSIELEKQFAVEDSLAVVLDDQIVIEKQFAVEDDIIVSLTDTIELEKQISLSDSLAVALADTVDIASVIPVEISDSLAVNISEKLVVHGTPFPVYEGNTEPFTQISGAGATSIDVDNAPDTQEGDLLIAVISWRGIGTIAATDGGWDELHDFPDTTGPQLAIYTREATASEPSDYNFTFSGDASRVIGGIIRASNHNGVEISAEASGNSTSPTVPSVNSGGDDRLLLGIIARSHYNLITPPSGNALRWNETTPTFQGEAGAVGQLGFTEVVGSGATGTRVATLDTTARDWRAVAILIAPAVEGEPIDVSDSLAITIDDQIEVVNAVGLSDAATVALSDSISLRKTSQWSDEASATTFAAGDNKDVSDSIVVALDDQIQIDKQLSLSDSLAVSVVDQIELEKHIELSDDITVSLDDQIHLEKPVTLTDELSVAIDDQISVLSDFMPIEASDSIAVQVADDIEVVVHLNLSDSLAVALDDQMGGQFEKALTDDLTIALDDQMVVTKPIAMSDTLAVSIDDQVSVSSDTLPKFATDDLAVDLVDVIQVDVDAAASDGLAVVIDDAISIDKSIGISDDITVNLVDSISIDKDIGLLENLVVAIDDQISVAEQHEKSASDTLAVGISDSISVQDVVGELNTNVTVEVTVASPADTEVTVAQSLDQEVTVGVPFDYDVQIVESIQTNVSVAQPADIDVTVGMPADVDVQIVLAVEAEVTTT